MPWRVTKPVFDIVCWKQGYSELASLHTPSLHSFKEEDSTYGPLGGMDGSPQWKWEDMSTRSIPSVIVPSLFKVDW